jgi:hypothetical protein
VAPRSEVAPTTAEPARATEVPGMSRLVSAIMARHGPRVHRAGHRLERDHRLRVDPPEGG